MKPHREQKGLLSIPRMYRKAGETSLQERELSGHRRSLDGRGMRIDAEDKQ